MLTPVALRLGLPSLTRRVSPPPQRTVSPLNLFISLPRGSAEADPHRAWPRKLRALAPRLTYARPIVQALHRAKRKQLLRRRSCRSSSSSSGEWLNSCFMRGCRTLLDRFIHPVLPGIGLYIGHDFSQCRRCRTSGPRAASLRERSSRIKLPGLLALTTDILVRCVGASAAFRRAIIANAFLRLATPRLVRRGVARGAVLRRRQRDRPRLVLAAAGDPQRAHRAAGVGNRPGVLSLVGSKSIGKPPSLQIVMLANPRFKICVNNHSAVLGAPAPRSTGLCSLTVALPRRTRNCIQNQIYPSPTC